MDPLLLGVAGTAFSAFVASVGYCFKLIRDRKRTTRVVLYYLLEIHHRLSGVVELTQRFPGGYLTEVADALKRKGLELPVPELDDLEATLRTTFHSFAATRLDELSRELLTPYQAALLELAKDNPVLAFELKGRESLSAPTELLSSLRDTSEPEAGVAGDFVARLEGYMRTEMLTDMEVAVRLVAFRCSFLTLFRVRQTIKGQREFRRRSTSGPHLEKLVDEMIQQAIASATQKASRNVIPKIELPPSLR